MANIRISDIEAEADTLENQDLILVSKKNTDGTFTSAKMTGEKLKNSTGTTCQASSALTSYGTAKTSDVTSAKNAIQTSISGLNNLSKSQVQSACSDAISSSGTSVNVKGVFIDPNKFSDGYFQGTTSTQNGIILPYDSIVTLMLHSSKSGAQDNTIDLYIKDNASVNKKICQLKKNLDVNSNLDLTVVQSFYIKKDSIVYISISGTTDMCEYTICPLG